MKTDVTFEDLPAAPERRIYHMQSRVNDGLFAKLREATGVAEAYMQGDSFSLSVVRGQLFTWEEVHPGVMAIIQAHSDSSEVPA